MIPAVIGWSCAAKRTPAAPVMNTPTMTVTASPTGTVPTGTPTPSRTASHTVTATVTMSATVTPTDTPDYSPTITMTSTVTATFTLTPEPPAPPASNCSFGGDTAGTENGFVGGFVSRAARYNIPSQTVITHIAVYIYTIGEWTDAPYMAGIRTNSASDTPDINVIHISGTLTNYGWNLIDIPDTTLQAGDYWFLFASNRDDQLHQVATMPGSDMRGYGFFCIECSELSGGVYSVGSGYAIKPICQ